MSFYSTLRNKHLGDKPLNYLWELKVTDAEYDELKQLLAKYAKSYSPNCNNRFITVSRECTLFVAEFWRREYKEGSHSKEIVFKAIESTVLNDVVIDEFYEAAKRGMKLLGLELYEGDGGKRFLDSMLYQGGLPMKLVTGNIINSRWDRFTRGLVNRKINFEELDLGIVASNNKCLKAYCNQLIYGIETERFMHMPFYCQNENDVWYLYLIELAKQEKVKHQQQHPLKFNYEFKVDFVEKKIDIKFVFKGNQRLLQAFLDEQSLQDNNFFSIQVKKNDRVIDTFDYVNNFCRYPVISKHPYNEGDNISVYLHNHEDPYMYEDLDMNVPHILYRDKEGMFFPGNHIGQDESLLLIPEGWEVENVSLYTLIDLSWGDKKIRGIHLKTDFKDEIAVKGIDGIITFGMNAQLYWTEIQSHPLYMPNIIEPLYNATKCKFTLSYDTDDGTRSKRSNVQFRCKWQSEWSDVPSYGEIFVRAKDDEGHFVSPTSFVNIGDQLSIGLLNADKNTCRIRVSWPYGKVSTTEGERKVDDVWEIKKENCHNPKSIRFLLTPTNNARNQFYITVKAPFKDFSIVNIYGENIENESWIPYSDIDKYQYHLVGQDVKEYTYGDKSRQLRWRENKLHIYENGRSIRIIPYEGSLINLFDSREIILSMLERTSKDMIKAEVIVQFTLGDGSILKFYIKESPFLPRQMEDGRVVIMGYYNKSVKFTGVLKLLKLSDPLHEAEEIHFNEETGCYLLPETIRSWGKTLLIGRTKGRIRPTLVDLTTTMNGETRARIREEAIASISNNLANSFMGDEFWQRIIGWFERSQKEDIQASSILELLCTARDYKSLLCLAFQLYAKCENKDDCDVLKEKMKSFSNDLAFQWYWLQPYLSGLLAQLMPYIDPMLQPMQKIYIKWAVSKKGEDMMSYLSVINDKDKYLVKFSECIVDLLNQFTSWIEDLCIESLMDAYGFEKQGIDHSLAETIIKKPEGITRYETNAIKYVESTQGYLGEEATMFFDLYGDQSKTDNENWLLKRVKAVAAHLQKKINLFQMNGEIRRSIIFCCKSSNQQFVISLNNQLCRKKL